MLYLMLIKKNKRLFCHDDKYSETDMLGQYEKISQTLCVVEN